MSVQRVKVRPVARQPLPMTRTPCRVVGIIYTFKGADHWHSFSVDVELWAGQNAATLTGQFTISKSGEIADIKPAAGRKGKRK